MFIWSLIQRWYIEPETLPEGAGGGGGLGQWGSGGLPYIKVRVLVGDFERMPLRYQGMLEI